MIKLKNREQVAGIEASCALLSALFAELRPKVAAGVTTGELDEFTERWIRSKGGEPAFLGYGDDDNPFPASLCVSINEEVIHGIPGDRKIRPGDLVGLDCGIGLRGFYSDAAISVAVPPISAETERLSKVTKECLELALKAARPGGRIHDLSRAVFAHAKAAGFGVVREYCGHGVGFSQHEDPQVPNYVGGGPNPRLVPGMVLAVEPMINAGGDAVRLLDDGWTVVTRDGSRSAHFEHTIVIEEGGARALTSW